jgi:hypothetical protein
MDMERMIGAMIPKKGERKGFIWEREYSIAKYQP